MSEKSTSFRRTLFDVILMGGKSAPFRRTFFNIILLSEKWLLFPCTFFDLISVDKKLKLFWCIFLMQFRWKADATLACFCWYIFERQKIVIVLISLFHKILIYCKLKLSERLDVLFQSYFVPSWNMLGDYTVFKYICTSQYLIWSYLFAFARFLPNNFWKIAGNR